MESINELMLKEHGRLLSLLINFSNEEDKEKARELFENFKWTLEKHFFVEEKAIFDLYQKIKGKEVEDTFELMKEHGEMVNLLKDFEYENVGKFDELKSLLQKHQKFEDENFYPHLDKELDDYKKKELIEKIKEVIRV